MKKQEFDNLVDKLKSKYGTHRAVAKDLSITEDYYFMIRTGRRVPSGTLLRLMKLIAR